MSHVERHTVYLSLGTNLGDKEANLSRARDRIRESCGSITGFSGIYHSPSWGYDSMNDYFNQCVNLETALEPAVLMQQLLATEEQMGRKRTAERYADRIIDIDILFIDDLVLDLPGLTVPHPYIAERRFVLLPMTEIAPDLVHPTSGKTIGELLEALEDDSSVERLPVE